MCWSARDGFGLERSFISFFMRELHDSDGSEEVAGVPYSKVNSPSSLTSSTLPESGAQSVLAEKYAAELNTNNPHPKPNTPNP